MSQPPRPGDEGSGSSGQRYQAALVTGASSGIGREIARLLGGQARVLVLVARRRERLDELAAELSTAHPRLRVLVQAVDLTDPGAVSGLARWLLEQDLAIDLLVNNAGFGDYGPFAAASEDKLLRMIALNIGALTQLTHKLLPGMLARRHGSILNVSSTAGSIPLPFMGVYAATKAYVNSFTDALRAELSGSGVQVTALSPGPVPTEFSQVAGPRQDPLPRRLHVSAEEVARQGLDALARNKARTIPGALLRAGVLLCESTPRALLRAVLAAMGRRRRNSRPPGSTTAAT